MRQAGRYMAAFREYSDKYPFRVRSETPAIAIELSLQCWRKCVVFLLSIECQTFFKRVRFRYGMDGVIMFSDILTPLPAMGIEFDMVCSLIKSEMPAFKLLPRLFDAGEGEGSCDQHADQDHG